VYVGRTARTVTSQNPITWCRNTRLLYVEYSRPVKIQNVDLFRTYILENIPSFLSLKNACREFFTGTVNPRPTRVCSGLFRTSEGN